MKKNSDCQTKLQNIISECILYIHYDEKKSIVTPTTASTTDTIDIKKITMNNLILTTIASVLAIIGTILSFLWFLFKCYRKAKDKIIEIQILVVELISIEIIDNIKR